MGSNQEKREVSVLEETNEGKIVKEISTSSMEQDIYVCGNYNKDFFKNYIIKDFREPMKPNIIYYETMGKHKEIKDWHFFFAPKGNSYSEMLTNVTNFLSDHNGFTDFDDFNEKSVNRNGKIVILYFIDENKDNFINYFINTHNQFDIPLIISVGNKSDNEKLKEKINKSIKELKSNRIINKNLFKFSDDDKVIENSLINLNINLIETSSFFNELGDEYKYPKQFIDDKLFDEVVKNIFENFATINILVCGRAGVGKSTFINGILDATICKNQKGRECSQRIIKYVHRKSPITFYDTPGMSTEKKMQDIIELIEKKNNELGEIQSKINAVFYLFNGKETRFFYDFESKMFELLLKKYKIPLYFLITRINREELDENKAIIIRNYYDVTKNIENDIEEQYKKEKIEKNIFCINMIGNEYSQTDELFKRMYDDFHKYLIQDEITKKNIEEITGNECLISKLSKPKDIIEHPYKLCKHITLIYRLIARSISKEDSGSTFLSSSFLRIINNIFCEEKKTLAQCKEMISGMNFKLDVKKDKNKKEFQSWFTGYYGYQTPAEEEISYLAYKYIDKYRDELAESEDNCLKYINKLRESLNKAIKGLLEISNEYKKKK